jgi:hypothetical protein
MRTKYRLLLPVAAFVAASAVGAGGAQAASSACPSGLLSLGSNPIAAAVTAALRADAAKNRPQAMGAWIATADAQRGAIAKAQCGSKVWQRTVVVYITDRALLPAQSASQRVLFVGRTKAGFKVWQRVH